MLAEIQRHAGRADGIVLHRVGRRSPRRPPSAATLDWDTQFFRRADGAHRVSLGVRSRARCRRRSTQRRRRAARRAACGTSAPAWTSPTSRRWRVLEARRLPPDGLARHLHHAAAQRAAERRARGRHDSRLSCRRTAPSCCESRRRPIAGFRGRFHLDPHIPDDRCDAFYRGVGAAVPSHGRWPT